jgi:hypothetical protein
MAWRQQNHDSQQNQEHTEEISRVFEEEEHKGVQVLAAKDTQQVPCCSRK